MNSQSLVFGILITFGIVLTTFIVFCSFKIQKLSKKLINFEKDLELKQKQTRRILEEISKDITMVERTIMQRIYKTNKHIDEEVHQIHLHENELQKEIEQVKSYTETKLDKVVITGTFPTSKPKSKKYFNQDPL